MAPVSPVLKKKTWADVNKTRKEEKKKRKEKSLLKKVLNTKISNETVSDSKIKSEVTVESKELSTLSIAVPGSILENAQSLELRTYLAGQIARAACIFQVDEIVVFDDYGDVASAKKSTLENDAGTVSARHSCIQLGRILQYLECPQYLRKHFFPIHKDLKFCGILNPLNAPHHLGPSEEFSFREGVVMNKPTKTGQGSYINIGLSKEVHVDKLLTAGIRCTVKLLPQNEQSKKRKGVVVSPTTPRSETGVYWGYSVRIASSLSKVFSQCPYKNGYDLSIGTSDKGSSVDEFSCPTFNHMLVVFGGLQGIEAALENDDILNVDDPKLLFDHYLNTLPEQGSKTIRTEEAVLVSLSALRPKLNPANKPIKFEKVDILVMDADEHKEIIEGNSARDDCEDPLSRFD
ncbi:putative methyltransferase C9orf114 [Leptinotarsa decemlineata]|uniref:putative methyltransferase C9orf114 n=1 Tax=Leptinotarsa decemlineata TaxID=7539 RepID=UPI003D30CD52